jgi:hypothetical protein
VWIFTAQITITTRIHRKVSEVFTDMAPINRRLSDSLRDFDWVREEDDVAIIVIPSVANVDASTFVIEPYFNRALYSAFLVDFYNDTCAVDGAPDFLTFSKHNTAP